MRTRLWILLGALVFSFPGELLFGLMLPAAWIESVGPITLFFAWLLTVFLLGLLLIVLTVANWHRLGWVQRSANLILPVGMVLFLLFALIADTVLPPPPPLFGSG